MRDLPFNNENFLSFPGIVRATIFLFLLASMGFSGAFTTEKIVLLGASVALSIIYLLSQLKEIKAGGIPNLALVYIIFSWSFLNGFHNGYVLSGTIFEFYLVTPFVAYLLGSVFKSQSDVSRLFDFIIWVHIIILALNVVFIFNTVANLQIALFDHPMWQRIYIGEDRVQFRNSTHTALMFTAPVFVSWFFLRSQKNKKFFFGFVFFLTILIVIVSGRRALQVVVPLALLLSVLGHSLGGGAVRLKYLGFICVVAVSALLVLPTILGVEDAIANTFQNFMDAFGNASRGASVRSVQIQNFLVGIEQAPFFGQGAHSYLRDYLRSDTGGYSYELVYLAFLYQVGLVPSAVLLLMLFGYFVFMVKLAVSSTDSMSERYISFIIGSTCFFIAGATNPLLYSVWFWVLLVAFANTDQTKIVFTSTDSFIRRHMRLAIIRPAIRARVNYHRNKPR